MVYEIELIEEKIGKLWHNCISSLHLDDDYQESNKVLLDAAYSKLGDVVEIAMEIENQRDNLQEQIDKIKDVMELS